MDVCKKKGCKLPWDFRKIEATRLCHIDADSSTYTLKSWKKRKRHKASVVCGTNRSTACHRASTTTTLPPGTPRKRPTPSCPIPFSKASKSRRNLYPGTRGPSSHSYSKKPSAQIFHIPTFASQYNSRSSIVANIPHPTAQLKRLILERISIDIANSPVHDSRIRARAQDELGCFGSPVPVIFGDS
jgi:hypothetical protein